MLLQRYWTTVTLALFANEYALCVWSLLYEFEPSICQLFYEIRNIYVLI